MKGLLYILWAGVLMGLLNVGWMVSGFKPVDEVKIQLQHFDDYMNARGQYGGQR